jgi:hypothetical protein
LNVPMIADVEDSSSFVRTCTFNAFVALLIAILNLTFSC